MFKGVSDYEKHPNIKGKDMMEVVQTIIPPNIVTGTEYEDDELSSVDTNFIGKTKYKVPIYDIVNTITCINPTGDPEKPEKPMETYTQYTYTTKESQTRLKHLFRPDIYKMAVYNKTITSDNPSNYYDKAFKAVICALLAAQTKNKNIEYAAYIYIYITTSGRNANIIKWIIHINSTTKEIALYMGHNNNKDNDHLDYDGWRSFDHWNVGDTRSYEELIRWNNRARENFSITSK
jgi:hypothetical protein